MSWLQRIGRALAFLTPDNLLIGLDWELERKRVNRLRRSFRSRGEIVEIGRGVVVHQPHRMTVGNLCYINEFVHVLGAGGVEIGNRVFIANHVSIISQTHVVDVESIPDAADILKPVVIEDDVWIGAHAVILPGVRLGRSCVVGAGSIVTKDVEPYCIVGGVPARFLRRKALPATPGAAAPLASRDAP